MQQSLSDDWLEKHSHRHVGKTVREKKQPGLCIRIGSKQRTWRLAKRINGKDWDIKLGTWPALNVPSARKTALLKLAELEAGVRPMADITIADAHSMWPLDTFAKSTAKTYRHIYDTKLKRFERRTLGDICSPNARAELVDFHEELTKRRSPSVADLTIKVLQSVISHVQARYPGAPELNLKRFPWNDEDPAEPDTSPTALAAHFEALAEEPHPIRRAFQEALYYTGMRPSSLFAITDAHYDREASMLRGVHTKIGPLDFPVTRQLEAVFDSVPRTTSEKMFDINPQNYALKPKAPGSAIKATAMRKHYSTQAVEVVSFAMAERLMGHRLPGSSKKYIRPNDEALFGAAQSVADHLDDLRSSLYSTTSCECRRPPP